MIDTKYLDAIKSFEGFTPRAKWDYAQSSNGYGTKALYEGEIIDRAEADRRFKAEIKAAYDIVENFAPNLDDGSKAALTSLTYNAGTAWTKAGLGNAIRSGDIETAKAIFQQYNKAGGEVLAGLDSRRSAEAAWFNSFGSNPTQPDNLLAAATPAGASPRIPEIAFAEQAASPSVVSVVRQPASYTTSGFDAEPNAPSIIDRNSPQLRRDAALTLANILSIISANHLEKDATAKNDGDASSERRAADALKRAADSAA